MSEATFEVTRSWLENKGKGHDKFYQPFFIRRLSELSGAMNLTVGHYGPNKVSEGIFSRPVRGGQVILYGGGTKYLDLKTEKQKKGYVLLKENERLPSMGQDEFLRWVKETFGATHGHKVLQHFGLTLDGVEVDVPEPSNESDTAISEPDERPPEWGSW